MGVFTESLERRYLHSQTFPAGSMVERLSAPDHTAGLEREVIRLIAQSPTGSRLPADNSPVQLSVVAAPGQASGSIFATGRFIHGVAVLRSATTLQRAGDYTLVASSAGLQSGESGFHVNPGPTVSLKIEAAAYSSTFSHEDLIVDILDKFGNFEIADQSLLMLGATHPAGAQANFVTAFDSSSGPVAAPGLVYKDGKAIAVMNLGPGIYQFSIHLVGTSGSGSVELVSSNKRLKHILTPVFPESLY